MANKPDKEELKKRLTPFQWHVTQEKGTERPFTGAYNKHYEAGTYTCLVCEQKLFSSEHKYDSGCGWPAFNDVIDQGLVTLKQDTTLNMKCDVLAKTNEGESVTFFFFTVAIGTPLHYGQWNPMT
ncbi:hypothetical protein QAD02_023780 [Eretmocerus hayati]|uniref:Uncharacterized protein n=1 Tax=Eretmocerus hayati TaxID=131215 RepID=A0ACC2PWL3_9HYME|nr:hypothetical protein QAD02_023780 [Eretmocerus hayati]